MKTDPQERLEELRGMLEARLDKKRKPLTGYMHNVELIRAEIARLEVVIENAELKARLEKLENGANGG